MEPQSKKPQSTHRKSRQPRGRAAADAHDSLKTWGYNPGESERYSMIRAFEISGYRGFSRFEMTDLGRLTLLVGRNNSGKTSVLEALYVLGSGGDFAAIWELCSRRGERLWEQRDPRYMPNEVDISHLFNGHEPHPGTHFTLRAKNSTPERVVSFAVAEPTDKEKQTNPTIAQAVQVGRPTLVLHVTEQHRSQKRMAPLINGVGLSPDALDQSRRNRRAHGQTEATQFISSESLRGDELISLWDKITLTTNEETVLRALRFIDPKIERIAPQSAARLYGTRGGFIIKHEDMLFPVPIGSMGDGAWRMLAMAIAITQCRDGLLLIDEIDTGLHYTVMADMWRLIQRAAEEFNVQVFATTHSYDCVHSLAKICRDVEDSQSQITIQRIESGKGHAVKFSESEIKIAAEREIEIR